MSENKVTQEQIDGIIEKSTLEVFHHVHDKQCLVVTKLPNGFTVVGESACVDPANYCEQIGFDLAVKHIKNRLWELEGYALQNKLCKQPPLEETTLKTGVYASIVNDSFTQPFVSQLPEHVRYEETNCVGDTSTSKTIEGPVDDVIKVLTHNQKQQKEVTNNFHVTLNGCEGDVVEQIRRTIQQQIDTELEGLI